MKAACGILLGGILLGGILVVASALSGAVGAQAEPRPTERVAGMYAEAVRLAVTAEEAERILRAGAEPPLRRDIALGVADLVARWTRGPAAGVKPAEAQVRR